MLIALFFRILVPYIGVILFILAGMAMLFGAVGMAISKKAGATIIKVVGSIIQQILKGISWILKETFRGVRDGLITLGLAKWLATVIAAGVVLIVIIII